MCTFTATVSLAFSSTSCFLCRCTIRYFFKLIISLCKCKKGFFSSLGTAKWGWTWNSMIRNKYLVFKQMHNLYKYTNYIFSNWSLKYKILVSQKSKIVPSQLIFSSLLDLIVGQEKRNWEDGSFTWIRFLLHTLWFI